MPCSCKKGQTASLLIKAGNESFKLSANGRICYRIQENQCAQMRAHFSYTQETAGGSYNATSSTSYIRAPFYGMFSRFNSDRNWYEIVSVSHFGQYSNCSESPYEKIIRADYYPISNFELLGIEELKSGKWALQLLDANGKPYKSYTYDDKPYIRVKCNDGCSPNECKCEHQGFVCCIDSNGNSRRV